MCQSHACDECTSLKVVVECKQCNDSYCREHIAPDWREEVERQWREDYKEAMKAEGKVVQDDEEVPSSFLGSYVVLTCAECRQWLESRDVQQANARVQQAEEMEPGQSKYTLPML